MAEVIDLDKPDGPLRIAAALHARVSAAKRAITFEVFRLAALNTPVKSGRGRWGWYVSVGSPSDFCPPPGIYDFPDISDHGGNEISDKSISIDATFYVTNNVYYLAFLNNGTRYISPRRFVEKTISQAAAIPGM